MATLRHFSSISSCLVWWTRCHIDLSLVAMGNSCDIPAWQLRNLLDCIVAIYALYAKRRIYPMRFVLMLTSPSSRTPPLVHRYIGGKTRMDFLTALLFVLAKEQPCTFLPWLFDGTRYSYPHTRGYSSAGLGWFRDCMVCDMSIHRLPAHRSIPEPSLSSINSVPGFVRSIPARDKRFFWSDLLGSQTILCTVSSTTESSIPPFSSRFCSGSIDRFLSNGKEFRFPTQPGALETSPPLRSVAVEP